MWKIVFLIFITNIAVAQTTITTNEARWCVENYESVKEFRKLMKDKDALLANDSLRIILDNKAITSYKADSVNRNKVIANKDEIIAGKTEEVKDLKAVNKNSKWEILGLKLLVVALAIIDITKK